MYNYVGEGSLFVCVHLFPSCCPYYETINRFPHCIHYIMRSFPGSLTCHMLPTSPLQLCAACSLSSVHVYIRDRSSKRRKTDDSRATLNFSTGTHTLFIMSMEHDRCVYMCITGSRSVDQKMVERFMVATECWDFLQSNVTYQQGQLQCKVTFCGQIPG